MYGLKTSTFLLKPLIHQLETSNQSADLGRSNDRIPLKNYYLEKSSFTSLRYVFIESDIMYKNVPFQEDIEVCASIRKYWPK